MSLLYYVGHTSNIEYFAQLVNRKTQYFAERRDAGVPIYDNVKNACKERGISVSELEEKLGFARSSIYKWDKHCPSVEKVSKVADYFGVDIKYLLEE